MKNIIVFAMSTLPKGRKEPSDFAIEKDVAATQGMTNFTVKDCVSQMEPVTRLIMQNYSGETELIILCTSETEKLNDRFVSSLEPGIGAISAVEYYLLRLQRTGFIDVMELKGNPEKDERTLRFTLGRNRTVSFYLIRNLVETNGNKSDVLDVANLTVGEIRRLNKDDKINLFIAANGGFRDVFMVISAISSMLKLDDISVKGIYSTKYASEKGVPDSILDIRKSFDMFEFVSGLNEFDKYGDVDTLMEYFSKTHGDKVKNDKLIKGMKDLSDGLSYCNINLYKAGLDRLRELFSAENPDSLIMNHAEFQIFRDEFRNDYSTLLDVKNSYRIIDIVERCVRKKRLQQALTFIEAKFTDDLFNSGVLYFDPDEQVTIGIINNNVLTQVRCKAIDYIQHAAELNKESSDDAVLLTIQGFGYNKYRNAFTANGNKLSVKNKVRFFYDRISVLSEIIDLVTDNKEISEIEKKLSVISGIPEPGLLVETDTLLTATTYEFQTKDNKHKPIHYGLSIKTDLPVDHLGYRYRLLAGLVLILYYTFKDARNRFNHGNADEQPDHTELIELLKIFCRAADILLNYADKQRKQNAKTISANDAQLRILKRKSKHSQNAKNQKKNSGNQPRNSAKAGSASQKKQLAKNGWSQ